VNFRSIGRIFTTTLTIRHGINVRHLPPRRSRIWPFEYASTERDLRNAPADVALDRAHTLGQGEGAFELNLGQAFEALFLHQLQLST
jgi:hypothetical protein